MTEPCCLLPLVSSKSPSVIDRPLHSLSAFGVILEVTIEKIALTTSAQIASSLPRVTLPPLVLLSNATFVVDGDMGPAFVPSDSVVCAIQEDILLTTVHLHTFPLNRPPISMGLPLTQDRNSPRGVLIELGVR
jgi:hypothetical protein